MSKKVGCLSTGWNTDRGRIVPGSTVWHRMLMPGSHLVREGHDVVLGELGWNDKCGFVAVSPRNRKKSTKAGIIKGYDSSAHENLDVVVLKLFMHKDASDYIYKARALGQKVVIDVDDHYEALPTDNLAFVGSHPKKSPMWNRNHMIKSYAAADAVVVSTQFLADTVSKRNKNTVIIRNAVEPALYTKNTKIVPETFGWVGAIPWRSDDLLELQHWISDFSRETNMKFVHAGVLKNDSDTLLLEKARVRDFPEENFIPVKASGILDSKLLYKDIDIGLVPLTKNSFNEAKSFLKGLEYTASGAPFVASDTYEYRLLEKDDACLIAKRPRDWVKHMNRLRDSENFQQMRKHAFSVLEEKHTLKKRVPEWEEVLEL